MTCPNCNADADALLIDCSLPLGSEARDRVRYCYACRPSARHPYANCLPQVIRNANIPESEKQAAFAARRFAVDRRQSYPIEERVIDLVGPVAGIL